MTIRPEVQELSRIGPLPSESGAIPSVIQKYQDLIEAIQKPITDDEARELVKVFGDDGCFGLASTLMHLIETSPGWPLRDSLKNLNNEWIAELRQRSIRGGRMPEEE